MKIVFTILMMFFVTIVSIAQAPIRVEFQINNSSDDAEERGLNASSDPGRMDLTSSDLELVRDGNDGDQYVGLRFIDIDIPTDAIISNAYIQFTVDEDDDLPGDKIIQVEDSDNPSTFTEQAFNISSRPVLSPLVTWSNIPVWNTVGDRTEDQRTPNLSLLVQSIVDRPGWSSGNAISFIIIGEGERVAESFDGDSLSAPILVVEYQLPQTLELQVSQSSDDAEERGLNASSDPGRMDLTSSDLELVRDGDDGDQYVGIRFQDLDIPKEATITRAFIQFTVDEDDDIPGEKLIQVEDSDNPETFSDDEFNISSRSVLDDTVFWSNIPVWDVVGARTDDQRTPDLSSLVQSIIARPGWNRGNAISFIITGEGERVAESIDGSSIDAPILVIEYVAPAADFDLQTNVVEGIEEYNFPLSNAVVSASIENVGLNPISNFEISYILDNETPVTDSVLDTIFSGQTYTHTFTQNISVEDIGTHQIAVVVNAQEDLFAFNDTITQQFQIVEEVSDVYFDHSSGWLYLDDGSDQGTAWTSLDFDDSDWNLGAGHFGFGENDEDILLNQGIVTYYFRKQVNVEDTSALTPLVLNLVSDDGAVVYVNGTEVYRSPTLPTGFIDFETGTDVIVETEFENLPIEINLNPSSFQLGTNTIAVEIHNAFADNVDLSFSAAISNEAIEYIPDGPYVYRRNGEIIVKQVTSEGPTSEVFNMGDSPILTAFLPDGRSFDFELQSTPYAIEPSEYEMPDEFFVTSDMEGEVEAFVFLLENAGVIDQELNWTYGSNHLFILGDVFDRGLYVTECLWLIYKLEQEARANGGAVHFVLGNHEFFNLNGNFQDAQSKYMRSARHLDETMYSFYNADSEFGQWFRGKNIIEKAGNSAIFVHAGLSPEVSEIVNEQNLSYQEINDFGRLGMDDRECPTLTDPADIDACQAINGSTDRGIYWYRGMAREEITSAQVDDILDIFNGEVVIFGHSLTENNRITPLYDQKVINIDVRHKTNFNQSGYMEGLLFRDFCFNRFTTDGLSNDITLLDPSCILFSVDEWNESHGFISISPNPFDNQLAIYFERPFDQGVADIYNSQGVLMKSIPLNASIKSLLIDSQQWKQGIYILNITSEGRTMSHKIIKAN